MGAPGSEDFVGCAADVVSTLSGFCLERQQRANEEKGEKEKPV